MLRAETALRKSSSMFHKAFALRVKHEYPDAQGRAPVLGYIAPTGHSDPNGPSGVEWPRRGGGEEKKAFSLGNMSFLEYLCTQKLR